jgi:hypothetical protein
VTHTRTRSVVCKGTRPLHNSRPVPINSCCKPHAARCVTFSGGKQLTSLVSDAEVGASFSEQLDAVDKALFAGHVQRRVFLLLVFRLHICTRPVVRCTVSAQRATTGRPLRVQGLLHAATLKLNVRGSHGCHTLRRVFKKSVWHPLVPPGR